VGGLADSVAYHWQARVVDQMEASGWMPYGGNSENAADVRIVVPVPTTRLVFTQQPMTTTAGATMAPVKVAVVDGQNNTITTFTGTVTVKLVNAGGAVLGGSTDTSVVSGVATFPNLSVTQAGSGYQLEATTDGFAAVPSLSFGINPGTPDHWVFIVQPSSTARNQPVTPAVKVAAHDRYSNVATSFTSTVYMNIGINPGGGTLQPGGTQRAATAGIATFEDLKIDQAGVGYTLVAGTCCMRDGSSLPFTVTP
jgi:hypothetical protein